MAKFEKVSRFLNSDFPMPTRKTAQSAGYDLVAAEDVIIPSRAAGSSMMDFLLNESPIESLFNTKNSNHICKTLDETAELTKNYNCRPTLVSTGVKCKLDPGTYLELSVRSSSPLKYLLSLANGVGIIDGDYYDNPSNEGEIFLQLVNDCPFDIKIQKGEAIGQGIIKPYLITEDDNASGERTGGFGSTTK